MQVNTREGSVVYILDGQNYGTAFSDTRFQAPYVCCQAFIGVGGGGSMTLVSFEVWDT